MSETVKIIWSGLTGRTGITALSVANTVPGVEIVGGLSRWNHDNGDFSLKVACQHKDLDEETERRVSNLEWHNYKFDLHDWTRMETKYDVLVGFSHESVFEQEVELAVRTHVPLISGTSGLSDRQIKLLDDATYKIPVFRGGNFRFRVKEFIDEAVKMAKTTKGEPFLVENFYEGKSLPSEISKVIFNRIYEETGKITEMCSMTTLPREKFPCHLVFSTSPKRMTIDELHSLDVRTNRDQDILICDTVGFDELAHDVLEIAKVMATKPVKKGEFYDLDEIWDDLPH